MMMMIVMMMLMKTMMIKMMIGTCQHMLQHTPLLREILSMRFQICLLKLKLINICMNNFIFTISVNIC